MNSSICILLLPFRTVDDLASSLLMYWHKCTTNYWGKWMSVHCCDTGCLAPQASEAFRSNAWTIGSFKKIWLTLLFFLKLRSNFTCLKTLIWGRFKLWLWYWCFVSFLTVKIAVEIILNTGKKRISKILYRRWLNTGLAGHCCCTA